MIKIQGHRGYPDAYPENTMPSFIATYETGAFGFEMDVRITADGEYAIIHDETLDRTTNGTGTVKFVNYYGYIDTLDAGSWFSPVFTGVKIPTLDDVLNEFKDKNVKLILNFYFTGSSKTSDIHGAIDKVVSKGMTNQVHIFAPPDDINIAKAYNPNLYTLNGGMATISTYQDILDNAIANNHNAVSISSNANDTDATTMINDIKSSGKEVHVSYLTSNYESRVQRFVDFGADYILGNDPLIMQNYVNSISPNDPPPDEEPPDYTKNPASFIVNSEHTINKPYGTLKSDLYVVKSYGFVKGNQHLTK
ncbi:MAG: glycerophosphodiester phosphodiesterase [Lactococcus lactis]|nr:glycerophosphodiester phosphodiesterase [Staphylococcus equorum]MDN6257364.1 glycerophosphodiester phosphodiesterase [Tetragenococcus halophilus]MDN6390043.1 glycerophosphodiester phosphodiesterase [Lactococcus lactis]MDN6640519.1 glycerophosphodiester phosphodiesterase [Tetragenococcus sp.]MDN6735956.1 glycerophosphodiester phosphodiesterase [Tetragenococcus koreensis]